MTRTSYSSRHHHPPVCSHKIASMALRTMLLLVMLAGPAACSTPQRDFYKAPPSEPASLGLVDLRWIDLDGIVSDATGEALIAIVDTDRWAGAVVFKLRIDNGLEGTLLVTRNVRETDDNLESTKHIEVRIGLFGNRRRERELIRMIRQHAAIWKRWHDQP